MVSQHSEHAPLFSSSANQETRTSSMLLSPPENSPFPPLEDESQLGRFWSKEAADNLQKSVDSIFGVDGSTLFGLEFSFTIADPFLEDCPLIGCSTGFSKLCGYDLPDILGRNQCFLLAGVPPQHIDIGARRLAKDFFGAVRDGNEFRIPEADRKTWEPEGRPADELLCMQKNIHKDGTLFNNMTYMKAFFLGSELGQGQPYIVALQSELKDGLELSALAQHLCYLDQNMERVKQELSASYFMQCAMFRQEQSAAAWCSETDAYDDEDSALCDAPKFLHTAFDPSLIQPLEPGRFEVVQKLCDATRSKGVVQLVQDRWENKLVAVKRMPTAWLCKSHEEFLRDHPLQPEKPWRDIGCTQFLNSVGYRYACRLEGVFSDSEHTCVNLTYAPGGDLFSVALGGIKPGPEREALLAHLVPQIFTGFKELHDLEIAHRDISLENILLTSEDVANSEIRIIDYGKASRERTHRNCLRGKASYQAPEMHEEGQDYDAFMTDAFSIGVLLYSLFLSDYPWMSTKPGACRHFDYVKRRGFRSFSEKRKPRGCDSTVAQCVSAPLLNLLEGLLEPDPELRLSLGEKHGAKRRSVWEKRFTSQCLAFGHPQKHPMSRQCSSQPSI